MTSPVRSADGSGGPRRLRLVRWAPTALWAVADQALFALSNFALNVLLARWLPAADYGAFAVAYSIFLLLGMVHSALLVEPLLVFGAGRHAHVFGAYLARVVRGHVVTGGIAALGVLVAAAVTFAVAGPGPLPGALIALALASPCILFQWLARRACYVHHRVRESAFAGGGYMLLVVGGAALLSSTGRLSVATALLLMGGASLAAGLWLTRRLGIHYDRPLDRRETAREHWRYGRWVLATGGLSWLTSNLLLLLLPVVDSLAAAGELRAGLNLLMPLMHLGGALATVGLPALVRAHRDGGGGPVTRLVLAGAAAAGLAYAVALVAVGNMAATLLYGEHYQFGLAFLAWLGLFGVGSATSFVLGTALRALERSDEVFRAHAVSAAGHVAAGLPLLVLFGPTGAAATLAITLALHSAVLAHRLHAVRPSNVAQ